MEKYIIKYRTQINGVSRTCYHETISVNERLDTNNVYVEHINYERRKAKRFFDIDEANKIANLFSNEYHIASIQIIK